MKSVTAYSLDMADNWTRMAWEYDFQGRRIKDGGYYTSDWAFGVIIPWLRSIGAAWSCQRVDI